MKTKVSIAIATAGLIACSAHATLTTSTGTSEIDFQEAITGFKSTEAVLDIAAGDGLLNEYTTKIVRRARTSSGWENQITYQSYITDSPYELAFLDPKSGSVETEGQFDWQSNPAGLVDFSVELTGSVLKADLGGMQLEYDTAPTGRIDAVGLWFGGNAGEYMSFNGFLNGNSIAASNVDSPAKWYLFELDDALNLLTGKLSLGSPAYPTSSLSMMVKFFSSPIPVPTPEPSTIALIGVGALGAISLVRRRKKVLVAQ